MGCTAVSDYDTCFASKSSGCPSSMVSSFTAQIDNAKSSLECEKTPAENSVSNPDAEDSASNSESASNVVTVACDTAGISKCAGDFSTGVAGSTNVAANCKLLEDYEACFATTSSGCSDSQKAAFTGPIEQAKSSLSCSEELASSANLLGFGFCPFILIILKLLISSSVEQH